MSTSIRCISENTDSAIAFYTDLLGFRLERYGARGLAIVSKGDVRLLSACNSPTVGSIIRGKRENIPDVRNQVRFEVDDLEAIAKRLTDAGMQFEGDPDGVDKYISLDDPSGNLVQLFEFSTDSYTRNSLPFWPLLVCPACRGRLVEAPQGVSCSVCEQSFVSERGLAQLDLRLRAETVCTKTFTIGGATGLPAGIVVDEMPPNARPAIPNWSDVDIPAELTCGNRLTPELLSYFPRADESDKWMLDLGCGIGTQRAFFEQLTGFKYLGIDWKSRQADLLVDAHSLPFKDESFDFVVCIAVLEHLRIPDLAMSEALRVLKPGGVLVGTAAFLEPFHLDSYVHMTHLAIYRTLRDAGFEVIVIAPNLQWTGLRALAEMSLFPIGAVPRWLKRAAVAPLEAVHRGAWGLKRLIRGAERTSELRRRLETTAGFRFVARRPSQS